MTQKNITHHIQKHIMDMLETEQVVRFRDLRLSDVDTNLLSYHLGLLQKREMIHKVDGGYSLGPEGFVYFGKKTADEVRVIVQIMLVIQNSDGDILMQKQTEQPHMDKWSLPCARLRVSDKSIQDGADALVHDSLGADFSPEHAGECYVRTMQGEKITTSTLAHVFRHYIDEIEQTDDIKWMRPHKLGQVEMVPGTEDIMTRTFFRDPHFFEEYTIT